MTLRGPGAIGGNVTRKLAKSLISAILTLIVLEGAVRLSNLDRRILDDPFARGPVLFQMFIPDPYLLWRNRPHMQLPWAPGVRLNARGLRGNEVAPRKTPGVRRIAVLGDSCTFGVLATGVGRFEAPRPYPEVLQELLDGSQGRGRYQVINYGTLGYTSFHGLRMLRREALPDAPDVVLIRFGWNDHLASPLARGVASPHSPWREGLLDLLYRSRLAGLLLYRAVPVMAISRLGDWTPSARPIVWVSPAEYAWNLSRMIDLSRAQGARPILLDSPPGPLTPEIRANVNFLRGTGYATFGQVLAAHERYQAIAERVAREKGVPLLKTAPSPARAPAYFSPFDLPHPNEAGQDRIARIVHAEIVRRLAPSGRRRSGLQASSGTVRWGVRSRPGASPLGPPRRRCVGTPCWNS